MTPRRSASLFALMAALILLGLWLARAGGSRSEQGLSAPAASTDRRAAEGLQPGLEAEAALSGAAGRAPGAGAATLARGALVLSASALPIEQVEIMTSGQPWQRVALVEGHLPEPAESNGLRVRSAGHLAMSVAPGDEVIELSPAATLTLKGSGARQRITGVRLAANRPEPERWLFAGTRRAGFVDDETWVLALQPDERWSQLVCEFELDGESQLILQVWPTRGDAIVLELPERAGPFERLACEVTVRGATTPVTLTVTGSDKLDRGQLRNADGGMLATWEHFVDVHSQEYEADDGRFQLPGFPSGRRFYLRAMAPAEGSESGKRVISNGEPVTLELEGGRVLRGRLTASGRPLPASIDLAWRFSSSAGPQAKRVRLQGAYADGVPVRRDGRFECGVPDDPMWAGMQQGPDTLSLTLNAPCFDAVKTVASLLPDQRDYDIGTLALSARTPEFTLIPPHPVSKRPLLEGAGDASILCSPEEPEVRHWVSYTAQAAAGGGEHYEVFLRRMQGAEGRFEYELGRLRYSWHAIDPPTPDALVFVQDATAYAYERASDGAYRGVACELRQLELELGAMPEGATRVELAWLWRGLRVPIDRYGAGDLTTSDVEQVVSFPLWAPRDGVELSIQFATNEANDGSTILVGEARREPLREERVRLHLP